MKFSQIRAVDTNVRIDQIDLPLLNKHGVKLFVKRDDLIHEKVSGNKLYKLKYNIETAQKGGYKTILTFGGAYSNHIAATASFCHDAGLQSMGVIRGEDDYRTNPTLSYAFKKGMQLLFISREEYRKKADPGFLLEVELMFGNPYVIPEGGANILGIRGAEEMLNSETSAFDYIVTAMGTGTTFAGLVKAAARDQKVVGIPIHKNENLLEEIVAIDPSFQQIDANNYEIIHGHHLGGYAKWNQELLNFIRDFNRDTQIKLDPIYTGKAMMALISMIEHGHFVEGSEILFMHTGGLQGVAGFEQRHGLTIF